MEARIIDLDGNDVKEGEPGELILRGPNQMKCVIDFALSSNLTWLGSARLFACRGYLNKPEATASTIRDGWLYTGDIVIRDSDGF